MKQVLRDMRYIAVAMAHRDMPIEAKRLLEMSAHFPPVRTVEQIRGWRAELLVMQDVLKVRNLPNIQDALSFILTRLRALEANLKG